LAVILKGKPKSANKAL